MPQNVFRLNAEEIAALAQGRGVVLTAEHYLEAPGLDDLFRKPVRYFGAIEPTCLTCGKVIENWGRADGPRAMQIRVGPCPVCAEADKKKALEQAPPGTGRVAGVKRNYNVGLPESSSWELRVQGRGTPPAELDALVTVIPGVATPGDPLKRVLDELREASKCPEGTPLKDHVRTLYYTANDFKGLWEGVRPFVQRLQKLATASKTRTTGDVVEWAADEIERLHRVKDEWDKDETARLRLYALADNSPMRSLPWAVSEIERLRKENETLRRDVEAMTGRGFDVIDIAAGADLDALLFARRGLRRENIRPKGAKDPVLASDDEVREHLRAGAARSNVATLLSPEPPRTAKVWLEGDTLCASSPHPFADLVIGRALRADLGACIHADGVIRCAGMKARASDVEGVVDALVARGFQVDWYPQRLAAASAPPTRGTGGGEREAREPYPLCLACHQPWSAHAPARDPSQVSKGCPCPVGSTYYTLSLTDVHPPAAPDPDCCVNCGKHSRYHEVPGEHGQSRCPGSNTTYFLSPKSPRCGT